MLAPWHARSALHVRAALPSNSVQRKFTSDENCIILVSYYQNNKGTVKLLYSHFKQIIQGFNDFLEVSWGLKEPTDINHKY